MSLRLLPRLSDLRLRLALLLAGVLALSACAGGGSAPDPGGVDPEVARIYADVQDGEVLIPAVDPSYVSNHNKRQIVPYTMGEAPGTIVVDPYARLLYLVNGDGTAMRYGIAVGKAGKGFSGTATIRRKEAWPRWTPTANMLRSEPELYGPVAAGLPGGLENPLGARALYLYRGGRDTYYRIHGTNNTSTIGRATSAGCIRLYNQDILDLYERIPLGTPVVVRSEMDSLAAEGPMAETEAGFVIPLAEIETPS